MSADTTAVTLSGGPVISPTRREEVAMRIRRALLAGELKPGQRITEVHLAEALGVSRPTVRESLQQLIHEGLLVQVPYRGIRVAQPTWEELADIAEVRTVLETMAALKLCRDPHSPGMDAVREALRAHLGALDSGDELRSDLTHLALHQAIWEQSGSATLAKMWPVIGSHIHMASRRAWTSSSRGWISLGLPTAPDQPRLPHPRSTSCAPEPSVRSSRKERQAALTPATTGHLTAPDHAVLVETGIGAASPRPRS